MPVSATPRSARLKPSLTCETGSTQKIVQARRDVDHQMAEHGLGLELERDPGLRPVELGASVPAAEAVVHRELGEPRRLGEVPLGRHRTAGAVGILRSSIAPDPAQPGCCSVTPGVRTK